MSNMRFIILYRSLTIIKNMNLGDSLPKAFPIEIIDIILSYYDVFKGVMKALLIGHTEPVTCIDIVSTDCLVSGSLDKTVRVWNTKNVKCDLKSFTESSMVLYHKSYVTCVAVFKENNAAQEIKYIVSGLDNGEIIIWDIKTVQNIRTLRGHIGHIKCISFIHSNNYYGNKIVSVSNEHIKIWNFENDHIEGYLSFPMQDDVIIRQNDNDNCVTLIARRNDGIVNLWRYECSSSKIMHLETMVRIREVIGILSNEFHPLIVLLGSDNLYIYDLTNKTIFCDYKKMYSINPNIKCITCAITLPNDLIIIGMYDGTLVAWSVYDKKHRIIGKHSDEIQSVFVLSEKHGTIASRSKNGTLKVWNVDMNGFNKNNSDNCIQTFTESLNTVDRISFIKSSQTFAKNKSLQDTTILLSKNDNQIVTYYNHNKKDQINEIIIWK